MSATEQSALIELADVEKSYRNVPRPRRQAIVADSLDRVGIVGKKDLFPHQLSGGQQQVVGVARAVIAEPTLLLADEPTGNLHTELGREIMELFRRLNQSVVTIVQVTLRNGTPPTARAFCACATVGWRRTSGFARLPAARPPSERLRL